MYEKNIPLYEILRGYSEVSARLSPFGPKRIGEALKLNADYIKLTAD